MKINNSYLKKNSTNLVTTKAMHWFNFILSVTNKLNITLPTWINVHRLEHFLFVPWPQLKIMCTDGMLLCNDHVSLNDNTNLYSLCSIYKSFWTWTQLIKLTAYAKAADELIALYNNCKMSWVEGKPQNSNESNSKEPLKTYFTVIGQ